MPDTLIVAFLSLSISLISVCVAVVSWIKNRKIYSVRMATILKTEINTTDKLLDKKLRLGKMTVLHVGETEDCYVFILGSVAKEGSFDKDIY